MTPGTTPDFGVLMINYNHGRYIAEAIESVRRQTFKNWELVVVDDASTDNSVAVASELVDDRIQIVRRTENGGMSAASRAAMRALSAPFIGILDADDVLEPEALEVMLDRWHAHVKLSSPYPSMIYSMHTRCDMDLRPVPSLWQSAPLPPGWTMLDAYRRGGIPYPDGNGTVGPFRTFSREAYDKTAGFEDRWRYSQDFDLTLKLEEIGPLAFVPEHLYRYRFDAARHASYPNVMHQIAREATMRRLATGRRR